MSIRSYSIAVTSVIALAFFQLTIGSAMGMGAAEWKCAPEKVCRDQSTLLPARVLTRIFATIYKSPEQGEANILSGNVKPFQPLYVFNTQDVDLSDPRDPKGWYQIGVAADGTPIGWMQAKDVVEWRQALIVAFRNPGVGENARKSAIFYADKEKLAGITGLEDQARIDQTEAAYAAIKQAQDGGQLPEDIVSVEPGPFVDIDEQFYMLPIIDWEDLGAAFLDESRHLQVIAITKSRAAEGESTLPGTVRVDDSATTTGIARDAQGNVLDLSDLYVDIVFVMDMSGSMVPWIADATDAVRDIANQLSQTDSADRVRFGFVGYRDNAELMPQIGFTAHNYSADELKTVDGFLATMQEVNAEMQRFAAARLSTEDYAEEVFAGVKTAIETTPWHDRSIKLIVLVGDASSHLPGHPQSTTGMDAPELRQLLNAQNVGLVAIHLREDRAAGDHPLAERQFKTLAANAGTDVEANYFTINALDRDGYKRIVTETAEAISGILNELESGGVAVASTSGQTASTSSAPAGTTGGAPEGNVREQVKQLGFALALPYLSAKTGESPPRDFTAWIFDRDLIDPRRAAMEVRLLINRDQLNDLVFTARKVREAINTAELTQAEFFEALQSVAATTSKGEKIDYSKVQALAGSGLAPRWIESLPYKSAILQLNDAFFAALSPDERANIEHSLASKLELYEALLKSDAWIALSDEGPEGEKVIALELDALP